MAGAAMGNEIVGNPKELDLTTQFVMKSPALGYSCECI